jgi:hypothetical protein
MRKMKVGELVFDFDLYPRGSVSTHHVAELVRALEAGAEFPPLVIDKKTKRIADGFHRGKSYLRHFGDAHEVDVIEKPYKNETELFLDAIRYNASHGLKMDTHDKAHCAILAAKLGIDDAMVAAAMHVDPKYIGDLRVDRSATTGKGDKIQVPIKRTIQHMAGRHLNKEQVAANDKLSGMNQQFYVNQVITLIESNLLDDSNEELMERLKVLHGLLDGILVA